MELSEKIKKIETAPGCPYDRADLIDRLASGRILSAGQARWLSNLGIDDPHIDSALGEQSPKARRAELVALAGAYDLSNKSIAKMINKTAQMVSLYKTGAQPIPPESLSALRRIVAAIDEAK